jgi:hypothetical protein
MITRSSFPVLSAGIRSGKLTKTYTFPPSAHILERISPWRSAANKRRDDNAIPAK